MKTYWFFFCILICATRGFSIEPQDLVQDRALTAQQRALTHQKPSSVTSIETVSKKDHPYRDRKTIFMDDVLTEQLLVSLPYYTFVISELLQAGNTLNFAKFGGGLFLSFGLADLLSGFLHSILDNLDPETAPWPLTSVVRSAFYHHRYPLSFNTGPFWMLVKEAHLFAIMSIPLTLTLRYFGYNFCAHTTNVSAVFGSVGHLPHACAHGRYKNNRFVIALQKGGVFLSKERHKKHHNGVYDSTYCLLSGWGDYILDPALSFLKRARDFFGTLEKKKA